MMSTISLPKTIEFCYTRFSSLFAFMLLVCFFTAESTAVSEEFARIDLLPTKTKWVAVEKRVDLDALSSTLTIESGRTTSLDKLVDRPTVVTFFYTRCTNARKCCSTVSRFKSLGETLREAGLLKRVRLLAITFEPNYDTPKRLNAYAKDVALEVGSNVHMAAIDAKDHGRLIKDLNVPVSYNDFFVNTHGVVLYVLDQNGRIARQYHSVIWDNDDVLQDVRALINESKVNRAKQAP